MKIAASSCCWWHDSLESAVRKAAAAGFTAFEPLTFPPEILELHGNLWKLPGAELGKIIGDHGMKLAALHLGAIMTSSEEKRGRLTDYAKRAIEVAAETGCKLIVEGGPDRVREPLQHFYRSLEEIVPFAASMGVRIALENHYGNWIQFIQDYEHIFDRIDHPMLGITLDTGHFTSAGVDPEAVARRFPGKIFHVHIKDHRGTQSVPLGTGQTNNRGTAAALKEMGYEGYFSQELEVTDHENGDRYAAEGLAYMKNLL